jgi:hypothetical protein
MGVSTPRETDSMITGSVLRKRFKVGLTSNLTLFRATLDVNATRTSIVEPLLAWSSRLSGAHWMMVSRTPEALSPWDLRGSACKTAGEQREKPTTIPAHKVLKRESPVLI